MIWQSKLWTGKKGLSSAWRWFLPHPAWNHKSKSMQTQAATVITYYSCWLEYVFSRYLSLAGSASKITVAKGKTPIVGLINMDHAIHFIHRAKNAVQNETNVASHYIYTCDSMSVFLWACACIILYEYNTKFGNTHCSGSVSPRDWTKWFLESLALAGGTEQLPRQAFCARWLESCIFKWLGLHIFPQKDSTVLEHG